MCVCALVCACCVCAHMHAQCGLYRSSNASLAKTCGDLCSEPRLPLASHLTKSSLASGKWRTRFAPRLIQHLHGLMWAPAPWRWLHVAFIDVAKGYRVPIASPARTSVQCSLGYRSGWIKHTMAGWLRMIRLKDSRTSPYKFREHSYNTFDGRMAAGDKKVTR